MRRTETEQHSSSQAWGDELVDFIEARTTETEIRARTHFPPDQDALDTCELARIMIQKTRSRPLGMSSPGWLTTLANVAALHADHPDYRRRWQYLARLA